MLKNDNNFYNNYTCHLIMILNIYIYIYIYIERERERERGKKCLTSGSQLWFLEFFFFFLNFFELLRTQVISMW